MYISASVCVCVGQCTHHPESSAGKGTVHSSCVQVSWLDLFICIYLHAVKRSCCWQLPMPTVFLDPGPILSAWLHGTAKGGTAGSRPDRSASTRVSCRSVDDNSNDLQTSASEGGMDKTRVNVGMQKRTYHHKNKFWLFCTHRRHMLRWNDAEWINVQTAGAKIEICLVWKAQYHRLTPWDASCYSLRKSL